MTKIDASVHQFAIKRSRLHSKIAAVVQGRDVKTGQSLEEETARPKDIGERTLERGTGQKMDIVRQPQKYSRARTAACLLLSLSIVSLAYGRDPCSYPSVPIKHPDAAVRFVAFGDSGSGSSAQSQLAEQMEQVRKTTGFDTALMLGDNLYPQGDTRDVESKFEKPYAHLLKARVRFYPVLGNHDVQTNDGRDEIAYFKMPGRWYAVRKGLVEFFMLDTNRRYLTVTQLSWLDAALGSSSSPWKIVSGHHPVYSSGKNGSSWRMRLYVEPSLVKHGVAIVLSGHDHNYERVKPQRGIHYFVSGGGGGKVRPVKAPRKFSMLAVSTHHFLFFELAEDKGWFQAVNICGRVFDSGTLRPTGK